MYEERKEKFSFKSFFLTLLLVLLFVFLMLWLFPNKWDVKNLKTNGGQNQSTVDLSKLSVLYDEIFARNVERMKDAAIGYFTNERMPSKVGESKKLTLKEMYDLHLVLKLKDKDGNPCDETKSYVEMTKYDNEYRLKVNLSCGEDEDYIIVYLGCYSYCANGICEKQVPSSNPKKTTESKVSPSKDPVKVVYSCQKVNGKYYNKGGNVVSKEEYKKSCESPKEEKYSCKVLNGKYYDKDGNVVNKTAYEKSCNKEPEKYSCEIVNGKYYDKDGNVVSKTAYEKSCNKEPEKYSCKIVDGKYYDKDGNVVNKTAYEKSCNTEPEKYSCKIVDGKYYDKDGNAVTEAQYKKSCGLLKTMYEYKLTIPDSKTCNAWSKWQKTKVTATSTKEVQTKVVNEVIGTKKVSVKTGEKTTTVVKQVQEQYISGYTTKLVYKGTKDVQVGTTQKTVTEKVAVGTTKVKAGIGEGTEVPANTSTKVYEVISQDSVQTCSNCKKEVKYIWQIYNIETVYKTVTKTVDVPVYKTIKVYQDEEVPVYDYRTVDKKETVTVPTYTEYEVPKYGDVKYYRYRNCTVTKGTTDVKWSYSNKDKDLLDKGYELTGNTKQV